jgi:hypothetical protein
LALDRTDPQPGETTRIGFNLNRTLLFSASGQRLRPPPAEGARVARVIRDFYTAASSASLGSREHAAVQPEVAAGDVGRFRTDEEADGIGDFFQCAGAAEWHLGEHGQYGLLDQFP